MRFRYSFAPAGIAKLVDPPGDWSQGISTSPSLVIGDRQAKAVFHLPYWTDRR